MAEAEDVEGRLTALEAKQPGNAYRRKAGDGHHHAQSVEGMDDAVSQGFGYQLNAGAYLTLTRGSWPNNRRLTLDLAGGLMNVDYVVDTSGRGTHTAVSGASGAYQAAIAAGGNKVIWLCSGTDETFSAVEEIDNLTSRAIKIVGPTSRQVTLTAASGAALFSKAVAGGGQSAQEGRIIFQGVRLAANSATLFDVDESLAQFIFEDVVISASGQDVFTPGGITIGVSNLVRALIMERCDVTARDLVQADGAAILEGARLTDCIMNLSGSVFDGSGGGGIALQVQDVDIQGGYYAVNAFWDTVKNASHNIHIADIDIKHSGANHCFGLGATTQSIDDISLVGIHYFTTQAGAEFANFGSNNINPNDGLLIDACILDGPGSGTAIEVDADYLNTVIGFNVYRDWTTNYSGPSGPNMDASHYHTIIRDDDNDTTHEVERTSDEDIHHFKAGGNDFLRIGDTDTQLDYFNSSILETTRVAVTSNGTVVTLALDKSGGGDLTLVFSDGYTTFDTTPAATVTLTPGSDTSPQTNYVYILQSNKTLTVSTSGFPSAEHAPIATVILQSAATTQTENALVVHVWHDHAEGSDEQGHASHIGRWIRHRPAGWDSGVAQTLTITTNAGVPDEVDFATTAGVVFQMHRHTVPAFDTSTGTNVHVVNDSVSPYTPVTDLADLLTDSAGGSMSGRYFNLVLWASVSEETGETHLFVNLPSGSYNKQGDAVADVSGFTDFNIPSDFRGTAFLISLLTLRHQAASGGTWTSIQEIDLRGTFPNTAAGGGTSAITTEFADNAFKLFDEGDVTKLLEFQLSGIASGNTRTLTIPDGSGTLLLAEGLSGGQTLIGDTASGGDLTLQSTAHATKGSIILPAGEELEIVDQRVFISASTSGTEHFGVWRSGEANPIFRIRGETGDAAAALYWGAGGADAVDISMHRDSANKLRLAAGDTFLADEYEVEDANYFLSIIGQPRITFDANDYLQYHRTNNAFEFVSGVTQRVVIDSSGQLQVIATGSGAGILLGGASQWYDDSGVMRTPDTVRIDGNLELRSSTELRFYDNGNYVGFEAPALAADQIWVLPAADGNANEVMVTDGGGVLSWAALSSEHTYVFVPDAAQGASITTGDQQGILHHSGDQQETVTAVYLDAETAPAGADMIIVIEYGDTDDLDTVASWTTTDTVTLTAGNKSVKDSTPAQATLPANRLMRFNVDQVGSTTAGADVAVHVKVKRLLTT